MQESSRGARQRYRTECQNSSSKLQLVSWYFSKGYAETVSLLNASLQQVWFQNQRAKMKKMQKKARQDNKEGKDAENDEKKLAIKEEEQSE